MQLEWEEVQATASEVFSIWVDKPELLWAEDAWSKLALEGLTTYTNELEGTIVLIRLLTLGTLYHEFCQFAFDEMADIDYNSWAETLNDDELLLSSFRLGQLIGSYFMVGNSLHEYVTEEDLLSSSIEILVNREREMIVSTLVHKFKGESLLFASLWLSPRLLEAGEDDYERETVEDVLSEASFDKMNAFEWVISGMPSIRGYSQLDFQRPSIAAIIEAGESAIVEFKQTLFNAKTQKRDRSAIDKVVKTVVAFINSEGGKLLIGVADDGSIMGIEADYAIANPQKRNRDGFQLYLEESLAKRIDHGLVHLLKKIHFHEVDGKTICEINVDRSSKPAYFEEKFYIRRGNSSVALDSKQLVEHIKFLVEPQAKVASSTDSIENGPQG